MLDVSWTDAHLEQLKFVLNRHNEVMTDLVHVVFTLNETVHELEERVTELERKNN